MPGRIECFYLQIAQIKPTKELKLIIVFSDFIVKNTIYIEFIKF